MSDEQETDNEDSASDAESYNEKISAKERCEKEAADFWKYVLSHPIGRREMWKILQAASTFEERFACGPNGFPQPEATWFKAGEQSLGLRLFLSWQIIDPAGVLLMQQEHDPRFVKPKAIKRIRKSKND
jgi:hypothetical protein